MPCDFLLLRGALAWRTSLRGLEGGGIDNTSGQSGTSLRGCAQPVLVVGSRAGRQSKDSPGVL